MFELVILPIAAAVAGVWLLFKFVDGGDRDAVYTRHQEAARMSGYIARDTPIPDAVYPEPQPRTLPEEPPRRELRGRYPTLSWHHRGAPFCAGWNAPRQRYYVSGSNGQDTRILLFRRQADMEACVKEMGYRGELP